MKRVIAVVALSAALAAAAEPKARTWDVDGVKREALVYVPDGGGPFPVVFAFHGHGGTAKAVAKKWALHDLWPAAVVVYPQGLPTPGKLTDPEGKKAGWQHGVGDQKDRDLKFFDAMLASLIKERAADPKRVYATGHSNGGGFTYTVWAGRHDAVAAVAPSAAAAGKLKPKPVLHLAGEKDALVKFEWQEKMIDRLKALNKVDPEGKPAGKYGTEYRSKDGPVVVTFIHPGGHEFPAGAAARIVEFFKAQPAR